MSMSVSFPPMPNPGIEKYDPTLERRRRSRSQVQWTVRFWGGFLTEALETVTQNLSSDGFYCSSRNPFVPGEQLVCTLSIPLHRLDQADSGVELECRVRVVRIDPASEAGYFGIGCKIEDYRLTRSTVRRDGFS